MSKEMVLRMSIGFKLLTSSLLYLKVNASCHEAINGADIDDIQYATVASFLLLASAALDATYLGRYRLFKDCSNFVMNEEHHMDNGVGNAL